MVLPLAFEKFTIEAKDETGEVLETVTINAGDSGTGDGIATSWSFERSTNDIYSIRFKGTRIARGGFGLGFDNFSARAVAVIPYSISGQVTDNHNNPLAEVEVSTDTGITATTDTGGYYLLTDLNPGTYTITPSKSNYNFSPQSRPVTIPPDSLGQNFIGTPIGAGEIHFSRNSGDSTK